MGSFDEVSTAVRAREAISRIARRQIKAEVPGTIIGRVVHVDTVAMRALVWIPGDPQPIPVRLLQGTIPASWHKRSAPAGGDASDTQGFGSTVVLQQYNGQQYIVDVVSGGEFTANLQALGVSNVELKPWNIGQGLDVVGNPTWSRLSVRATSLGAAVPVGGAVMFGPFLGDLNSGLMFITISFGEYTKTYKFTMQRNAFDVAGNPELEKWYRILPESEQFDIEGSSVIDWDLDIGFRQTQDTLDASGVQHNSIWFRLVNSSPLNNPASSFESPSVVFDHRVTIDSTSFSVPTGPSGKFVCEVTNSASAPVGYMGFRGGTSPYPDLAAQFAMDEFGRNALALGNADTGEAWTSSQMVPNGKVAIMSFTAANQVVLGTITPNISLGNLVDIDTTAVVSVTGTASAQSVAIGPIWRATASTGYTGHVVFRTDGTVNWALRTFNGNVIADVATGATGLTYAANERFGVRCKMVGTLMSMKVWKYDTAKESDATWFTVTDSTFTVAGFLGMSMRQAAGGTNHTAPVVGHVHSWRGGYGGSPAVAKTREISNGPWRSARLRLATDLQKTAYSTGPITWTGGYLSWGSGESIILGNVGRHKDGLSEGKAYCIMPTGGTVPKYPLGSSATVTSNGIPLSPGQSLWLAVPPGVGDEELGLYLFIVDDGNANIDFGVPEWAIFIAGIPAGTDVLVPGIKQPPAPTPPFAQVAQGATQNVTTTAAALSFSVEHVDTHGGHSNSTDTSKYFCVQAGWYELSGRVYVSGLAVNTRLVAAWRVNGADIPGGQTDQSAPTTGETCCIAQNMIVLLDVGDYVELYAQHTDSGNKPTLISGSLRDVTMMSVRYYAPPLDIRDETPVTPPPAGGSGTFLPIETRSWRSTGWRTDNAYVYQGQWDAGNHKGCAFFGTQISGLGAVTVTAASVRIKRRTAGGLTAAQPTTLVLYSQNTKPAGEPTVTLSQAGPSLAWGDEVEFAIPTSWGQALVNGTAGGIGFYDADGNPYVITEGKATFSNAWRISLTWV